MPRDRESGLTAQETDALARVLRDELERRWPDQSWTYRAQRLAMSQSQLSQVLQGSRARRPGVGIRVLVRLRNTLGIALDDLLGLPPLRATAPPPTPAVADVAAASGLTVDQVRAALRAELAAMNAERPERVPPPPPSQPKRQRKDRS